MNKIIIAFLSIVVCSCTTSVTTNDATIYFSKTDQIFGTLTYKKEASCDFQFTNTGNTPLVVLDVKTSCGCTVPEWTKKPIKPGNNGEIKIKYDAASPGVFHKTISVYYNGKDSPKRLTIKGEVAYPSDLEGATDEE